MTDTGDGRWISVDGVEAAGKTTLVNELRTMLPAAVVVDEFADDPVGCFLREKVKTSPHVFWKSLVGQSLLFLGEFWQRYDLTIRPALQAGETVISDRGYLSKYVYQRVVMEAALRPEPAHALLVGAMSPMPPPQTSIVLDAPLDVIEARLISRGETCDDARLRFIESAQTLFRAPSIPVGRVLFFDTSRCSSLYIAESAIASA